MTILETLIILLTILCLIILFTLKKILKVLISISAQIGSTNDILHHELRNNIEIQLGDIINILSENKVLSQINNENEEDDF